MHPCRPPAACPSLNRPSCLFVCHSALTVQRRRCGRSCNLCQPAIQPSNLSAFVYTLFVAAPEMRPQLDALAHAYIYVQVIVYHCPKRLIVKSCWRRWLQWRTPTSTCRCLLDDSERFSGLIISGECCGLFSGELLGPGSCCGTSSRFRAQVIRSPKPSAILAVDGHGRHSVRGGRRAPPPQPARGAGAHHVPVGLVELGFHLIISSSLALQLAA